MTAATTRISIAATPNHQDFLLLQVDLLDAVVDAKPVKVLYKDAEGINTFCINKVNSISRKVTKRSLLLLI